MIRSLIFSLLFLTTTIVSAQGIVIGSWNIERLGHGDHKNYEAVAFIANHFDFLAVQEGMTQEGLDYLESALETVSNESWGILSSHSIGRGSYTEKYAFLWRESKVAYDTGAVVYLDPGDLFAREPYSAQFKDLTTNTTFVASTVHILFGKSVGDRLPEIQELANYWDWLSEVYPNQPRLLMGDFNLPPTHKGWQPLYDQNVKPLIIDGKTTVSSTEGRYVSLYDNIFVDINSTLNINQSGILKFPELLNWSHEDSTRHVSDHTPVFVTTYKTVLKTQSVTMQPSATELEKRQEQQEGALIGNKNSDIYHRPDCPSYSRVSERNRRYFDSVQAAENAGYRLAGNCP
jgi:endonuclease/exonuclease/phosphatase family metal-dependent hydrolase